ASWPAPKAALAYSGVPKAGDPDFISTFEVKLPYITGAPGRTICERVMPKSASACESVSAPEMVIGAIAPASVKGVTIISCPLAAKSRSEEHTSELQSRGHLVCRLLLEKKTDNESS